MSYDTKIHELEERIKELDASVKEMREQMEAYEAKGMDTEAKKAGTRADGYYDEWLSCTTELANLVRDAKGGR